MCAKTSSLALGIRRVLHICLPAGLLACPLLEEPGCLALFLPLSSDPGSRVAWCLLSGACSNTDGRGKMEAWPRQWASHALILPHPCQSELLDKHFSPSFTTHGMCPALESRVQLEIDSVERLSQGCKRRKLTPTPHPTFAREEELLFPGLSVAVLWKLVGTSGDVLGSERL